MSVFLYRDLNVVVVSEKLKKSGDFYLLYVFHMVEF